MTEATLTWANLRDAKLDHTCVLPKGKNWTLGSDLRLFTG